VTSNYAYDPTESQLVANGITTQTDK